MKNNMTSSVGGTRSTIRSAERGSVKRFVAGHWRQALILLLCAAPAVGHAQFDERFYQPTREWRTDCTLPPHDDVWVVSGTDSIHAIWCAPEAPEPRAMVLYCHGNYGNISYNDAIVARLVEAGYAVLAWDYPGFGRSGGTPTHVAIAEAGRRVFEAMTARDDVRGRKVVLYGFSIGCHIAARLARENPERVAALVMDGGMKSFTDMALVFAPEEQHSMIRQYVTSPYSAIEDVAHLGGMPKLIAHSREDKVAPFDHSEAIRDAAAAPVAFLEYPGGHVSAIAANAPAALAGIEKLINQ